MLLFKVAASASQVSKARVEDFLFEQGVYLTFSRIIIIFSPVGVPVKVTNFKEGITKDSALDIFLYLNDVG